jgi:hypothetical protein
MSRAASVKVDAYEQNGDATNKRFRTRAEGD